MAFHIPRRWSRMCATSSLLAVNAPVAPVATVATISRVRSSSSPAGMARLNIPCATASAPAHQLRRVDQVQRPVHAQPLGEVPVPAGVQRGARAWRTASRTSRSPPRTPRPWPAAGPAPRPGRRPGPPRTSAPGRRLIFCSSGCTQPAQVRRGVVALRRDARRCPGPRRRRGPLPRSSSARTSPREAAAAASSYAWDSSASACSSSGVELVRGVEHDLGDAAVDGEGDHGAPRVAGGQRAGRT